MTSLMTQKERSRVVINGKRLRRLRRRRQTRRRARRRSKTSDHRTLKLVTSLQKRPRKKKDIASRNQEIKVRKKSISRYHVEKGPFSKQLSLHWLWSGTNSSRVLTMDTGWLSRRPTSPGGFQEAQWKLASPSGKLLFVNVEKSLASKSNSKEF
jgi:hypothetical protein